MGILAKSWFPNSLPEEAKSQGEDSGPDRSGEQEKEALGKRMFPNSLKDNTDERGLEQAVAEGPEPSMEIKTLTGERKVAHNGGYHSVREYVKNATIADFYLADLKDQDLSQLDVRSRDFTYSGLNNADLSNSNFKGSDFRGADLRGADLRGTDLSNALFDEETRFNDNTKFKDTNLDGADLSKVNSLSFEQMKGMKNLHLAKGKE